jgi:23S rRNA pseudouridine1911/1915/1917 synthase
MSTDVTPQDKEQPEELFEHYRFEADKGQNPLRVDKFLSNFLEGTSRNRIQIAAKAGSIRVNEKPVKVNYKVKGGDIIQVVFPHAPREIKLIAQDIPVPIVYRDEDVIVVNKPAGLVVHPGYGNYSGTLVNALLYVMQNLPMGSADERPGLVHRLDKNTSGIMVAAGTELAMAHLAQQFFDRTTQRQYVAIVWGDVKEDEGTITGHVGRSLKNRKVMSVYPEGEFGKHAVTHYKVLERFRYVTVVACKLETGRTHQIRVHMKYLGHPLFNDIEYGGDRILKGTSFTKYKQFIANCFETCPRHALHAKTLGFTHPSTKEFMEFDSEIPEDMSAIIEKFRTYTHNR